QVSTQCHVLDYSGIVILGFVVPCLYYGFQPCKAVISMFHHTSWHRSVLSIGTTVLNPEYAKPTHRSARIGVFIGLGLSAVVPVVHLLVSHRASKLFSEMAFS
ncbi:hypothetical protein BDR06DRAFT_1036910, partial [Suillus hirtellus]